MVGLATAGPNKLVRNLLVHEHVIGNLWQTTLVRHAKLFKWSPTVFASDKLRVALQVTYS